MIYIALLRAVNVGGKNRIKMADLKSAFEKIGMQNVQTYIQSGNVVFLSEESSDSLVDKLERIIYESFGFHVTVILRTLNELENTMNAIPFSHQEIADKEMLAESEVLYISFFRNFLSEKDFERLSSCDKGKDCYAVVNKEVYFLFEKSVRDSKLGATLQKIKTPSTMRNLNTLKKIIEIANSY